MRCSYPDAWFLSRRTGGGLTPPIDRLLTPPRALSASAQYTGNLSAYARHKHDRQPMSTPLSTSVGTQIQGAHTPDTAHAWSRTRAPLASCAPRTATSGLTSRANTTRKQRAYKTRPDQPVRARNVFGSGVRTLAVVRAVLTTIATLTTPLRHVILLGFVV